MEEISCHGMFRKRAERIGWKIIGITLLLLAAALCAYLVWYTW